MRNFLDHLRTRDSGSFMTLVALRKPIVLMRKSVRSRFLADANTSLAEARIPWRLHYRQRKGRPGQVEINRREP